jgi:hypothetical protein
MMVAETKGVRRRVRRKILNSGEGTLADAPNPDSRFSS